MSRRWWLWLPLLGLGAWLALFADKSPSSEGPVLSLPIRVKAAPASKTQEPQETLMALIPRRELILLPPADGGGNTIARRDLFSVRNWAPAPPPAMPVVVPAPTAPPLPFAFLGKKLEAGAWEIYLARGEQTFIVREGQVLDGIYRVDKIDPPALALTYLPLGQTQTLSIGDTR